MLAESGVVGEAVLLDAEAAGQLVVNLHCSMWQIGSGTSLVLQSTDVSTTQRRSIW